MAQRVVRLKPDAPAPGPAIVLRRSHAGESSSAFLVGYLDEKGGEDFRSLEEHADYDAALKAAQDRAHRMRMPVKDATGVTPATKADGPHAKSATPAAPRASDAAVHLPSNKDLSPLSKQFQLPEITEERLARVDTEALVQRALALHAENRDDTLSHHVEAFGDTRSHACTYTQKTHDQIQGQILGLFAHSVTVQAILYAQLEAAFARIDDMEMRALTVDSFDAQVAADDRTIELAFGSGEQRQVASFKWPVVIYRGIFKADQQYDVGDMTTHEGSGWIAQRITNDRPGTPNSGWQLAVKRGREGRAVTA